SCRVPRVAFGPSAPRLPIAFSDWAMSLVRMTVTAERTSFIRRKVAGVRASGLTRPLIGLLLPVGLAVIWEIVVRLGLSDGRLVPPPSVIYDTLADLARTGELQRHVSATLLRVAVGFAMGTVAGTLLGAIAGYSGIVRGLIDPTLQGLRAV